MGAPAGSVTDSTVAIPDRGTFKAADVCEIADVQPYVLRSWESEFPALGFVRTPGSPRLYRRSDVERVLRIRQLVYVEGLTLAGARRRLDDEAATSDDVGADVAAPGWRRALDGIKSELRALLDLLGAPPVQNAKPRRAARARQPTLLDISEEATGGPTGRAGATARRKPAGKRKASRGKR